MVCLMSVLGSKSEKKLFFKSVLGGLSGGVGWLLWAVMASMPWLLPTHSEPWPAFYSELLMAALLLPILVWSICVSSKAWSISWPVICLVILSFIPLVQGVVGLLVFSSEAVLPSIYIILFAVAVSLGRRAQDIAPYQLASSLLISLGIGAFLSTGLALYQWVGLDSLGVMVPVFEGGGGRAVANVAQPNNLSTLLVWGGLALCWGYFREHIGGFSAFFGAAFLLLGVALTGSRTGCVQLGFLAVAMILGRRAFNIQQQMLPLALLALWFVFLIVFLPSIHSVLWGLPSSDVRSMHSAGIRLRFWMMALEGVTDKPLLGYGWNQIVLVHEALAEKFPGISEVMGYSHNIFLDFLLWNGVVFGLLIVVGFVCWCLMFSRALRGGAEMLLMLVVGVFIIHAMLEMPHSYVFFLLPVGLILGGFTPGATILRISRRTAALVGVVFAVLLLLVFSDYRRIEAEHTGYRMLAARIAGSVEPERSTIFILKSLHFALDVLRTEPRRDMPLAELENLYRAVTRYPTTNGLFRYAQSAALNGNSEGASWALNLICDLRSQDVCKAVLRDWQSALLLDNPEMGRVGLPLIQ